MGPSAIILVTLAAAATSLAAASPEGTADPADVSAIVAAMQQASGGEAWTTVRKLHVVTTAVSVGTSIKRERWEDVATGRYMEAAERSAGLAKLGFDGVTAWTQPSGGVAYTYGDVDSALVAADESFRVARAWWFRDRHAATIVLLGRRNLAGRTYDVLSVTPEGGRAFQAWIDGSTHLLARTDEQQAEERVITTYGDYRPVHGLVLPFEVRTGDGGDPAGDQVETVRSVEINSAIADADFSIPAAPASAVEMPAGRDTVEAPFRLTPGNRIMVPVKLNGRVQAEAEFDSGGSLLLQSATVQKLGVTGGELTKQGGGGEGYITGSAGRIDTLEVGGARLTGLRFHSFDFAPNSPDRALVGQEVLQRLVVRFDFDRQVMTLTRPSAFHYNGAGSVVPFHFQDNQPEVKGSVDGVAGLFTIDTGDSGSLLLIAPFARRYDLVTRYQADIPYSGRAVGATRGVWARRRAATVTLDSADGRPAVEAHDPVTRISLQQSGFDADRNVSANIGLGVLRQFNLTFDYPRQQLIFERNHLYGRRDVGNRTGFRLKRDGAGWRVTTVYAAGSAAEAGLKTGDHISAMNGQGSAQVSDDEVESMTRAADGTKLVVSVDGAPTRSIVLILRDVY